VRNRSFAPRRPAGPAAASPAAPNNQDEWHVRFPQPDVPLVAFPVKRGAPCA